jgi:hypothetical protein
MGPTTRHQQALYLDHEKAELLDELSAETRIAKAVLLKAVTVPDMTYDLWIGM